MSITPEDRAARCARVLWASDDASKWAGMRLLQVAPGRAVMTLTVEPQHTNGHDMCHGGVIFMLADSAFAFASNSYNKITVAQHNTISFVTPAQLGDVLTATAREVSLRGRSGIYDVQVTRGDGEVIAELRGCSRILSGQHFNEADGRA